MNNILKRRYTSEEILDRDMSTYLFNFLNLTQFLVGLPSYPCERERNWDLCLCLCLCRVVSFVRVRNMQHVKCGGTWVDVYCVDHRQLSAETWAGPKQHSAGGSGSRGSFGSERFVG
jgi:hypothetical protein